MIKKKYFKTELPTLTLMASSLAKLQRQLANLAWLASLSSMSTCMFLQKNMSLCETAPNNEHRYRVWWKR